MVIYSELRSVWQRLCYWQRHTVQRVHQRELRGYLRPRCVRAVFWLYIVHVAYRRHAAALTVASEAGFVECFGQCFNAPNCTAVEPFNADGTNTRSLLVAGALACSLTMCVLSMCGANGVPEIKTMMGFFTANINIDGDGGVCASPSTSQPDYFYHWQRDSAISMREYMHTHSFSDYLADMQSYVSWVLREQVAADPNGIDIRGEPKFFLPGGACYNGGTQQCKQNGVLAMLSACKPCAGVVSVIQRCGRFHCEFACRLDAAAERRLRSPSCNPHRVLSGVCFAHRVRWGPR